MMRHNPGHLPEDAIGRRVDVELANGRYAVDWAADGRSGCRWSRTGQPFDIARYEVRA